MTKNTNNDVHRRRTKQHHIYIKVRRDFERKSEIQLKLDIQIEKTILFKMQCKIQIFQVEFATILNISIPFQTQLKF